MDINKTQIKIKSVNPLLYRSKLIELNNKKYPIKLKLKKSAEIVMKTKKENDNNISNNNTTLIKEDDIISEQNQSLQLQIKLKKELLQKKIKEIKELSNNISKINEMIEEEEKESTEINNTINNIKEELNTITQELDEIKNNIQQKTNEINARKRRRALNRLFTNNILSMLFESLLQQREEDEYPNVDNMTYEELLALEEKMGNVSKGLDEEISKKIKVKKYKNNIYEDDKCVICQFEFKNDESIKLLPCKHIFHIECIDEWLKNQKICPYCKSEIKI